MNKCNFCNKPIYVKAIQYAAPMFAPLTPEQELRDRLIDMTGEVYVRIESKYCPMCGKMKTNAQRPPDNYNFEAGM